MLKSGKYPVLVEYAVVQVQNGSSEQTNIKIICRLQHTDPPVRISIPATIVLPPDEQSKAELIDWVLEYVAIKYGYTTAEKFSRATADRPLEYWQRLGLVNPQEIHPDAIAKEVDYVIGPD